MRPDPSPDRPRRSSRPSKGTLRTRVALLVLLVAVPAFAAAGVGFVQDRGDRIEEAQERLLAIATNIHQLQGDRARDAHAILIGLASDQALLRGDGGCAQRLQQVLQVKPNYLDVGIARGDGAVVCRADPESAPDAELLERASSGEDMLVGRTGPETVPRVHYAWSVPFEDGRVVLYVTEGYGWMSGHLEHRRLPPGAEVLVLDPAGRLVVRHPDAPLLYGLPAPGAEAIQAAAHQERPFTRTVGFDGEERVVAAVPLEGEGDWTLAVGFPSRALLLAAEQEFLQRMAVLLTVTLAAGAAAWHVAGRLIVRPTQALERTASRIAAGDHHARTGLAGGRGEISSLALALDRMAGKIEDHVQALRRADRLKTDFINRAAHELATPLTPIALQTWLLSEGSLTPAQRETATRVLRRNVERLGRTHQAILQAAQLQAQALHVDRAPMDLGAAASRAAASLRPAAEAGDVTLDVHAGRLPVLGDQERLEEAVRLVVENAVRLTPPRGRVTVRIRRDGAAAVVEVHDEGVGLTPTQLGRLFEPFAQVHDLAEPRAGAGLGLYLARSIMDLHGGSIAASSPGPGRGATLTLRLPASEPT